MELPLGRRDGLRRDGLRRNIYTIEKRGVRKLIYQTVWRREGRIGGLVEFSLEIPAELPHYVRG